MSKVLPARASLEHLKAQAKDLLDAFKRGEPDAVARFQAIAPAAQGDPERKLHDAQSAIAREYGFASWNALREAVENQQPISPETLRALMSVPAPPEIQALLLSEAGKRDNGPLDLAQPLPVVPIRDALITAGSLAPFAIGRPTSIAAVNKAREGGVLAAFSQRDAASESPDLADMHPIGCAVRILKIAPHESNLGLWIVVRAIRWIRLESIDQTSPFIAAHVSPFKIVEENDAEIHELHRDLLARVEPRIAQLPNSEGLLKLTTRMTPLELADATVANLPCGVDVKADYAATLDLKDRLRRVIALL